MFHTLKRQIHSWGNGLKGQVGLGTLGIWQKPGSIPKLEGAVVKELQSGITHSAALIQDNGIGKLYIWGDNYYGQAGFIPEYAGGLFDSDDDEFLEPIHLEEGFDDTSITSISVGHFHGLALGQEGRVLAWCMNLTQGSWDIGTR